MNDSKKLNGKIALITGASSGIGRSVALRFAKEGAHVILVARSKEKLEQVDNEINDLGGSATLVPLNLKHGDKIDILGAEIANRYGYLDILIANAGILGRLSLVSHIPPKIWQEVFDINLHANYRLIRSFDPLLRNAKDSRAIFVTSGAAQLNQPYWSAYAASKAALEAMVQTYKAEIAHSNLQVKLLDPGVVATKMREAAIPGEDQTTLTQPDEITDKFIDYVIN